MKRKFDKSGLELSFRYKLNCTANYVTQTSENSSR